MSRHMKDSGIEWVGEVPNAWGIFPAKYAFSEIREKNKDGIITNALKFFNGTIVPKTNFDADSDDYVADVITNYTIVEPDTIMINGLNLNYDLKSLRVGLVRETGVITSAYLAIKPDQGRILPQYAMYLFKGYETRMAFHNMGAGIRKTLGFKEFKYQPILVPSLNEQKRIVSFLDAECDCIDSIIRKTEESIENYKKLRQSLIKRSVTRGVRGNRAMKHSGISFIGDVPKEWDVKRTKYIADSLSKGSGITKDDVKEDGDIQCVRYGEIYSKYDGAFFSTYSRTNESAISSPKYLEKGDIIFACTGELIEEIGKNIVYLGDEPCLAGGDIIVMQHSQNPIFLNYSLNSICSQEQKSLGKTKLKVVHISAGEIGNVFVALPPLEEQVEIANYLNEKCGEIDRTIEAKKGIVDELLLLKKSFIFEYATGKKEVPHS